MKPGGGKELCSRAYRIERTDGATREVVGPSPTPHPRKQRRRRAPGGDGRPRRAARSGPARGLNRRPRAAAAMTISPAAVRRAAAAASDRRGAPMETSTDARPA